MLQKIQNRRNEGFTLIELMVVVLLVMILSLAVVPAFKKIIISAKYAEGTATIGALRTKIKVFEINNSHLPGVPEQYFIDYEKAKADTLGVLDPTLYVGGASWGNYATGDIDRKDIQSIYLTGGLIVNPGVDINANSASLITGIKSACIQTLIESEVSKDWLIASFATVEASKLSDKIPASAITVPLALESAPIWQDDLDIDPSEYAGSFFKNQNYQYIAINAGFQDSSYAYAVAVTSGDVKEGTGYAVLVMENNTWTKNKHIVVTFERYKGKTGASEGMFLCAIGGDSSAAGMYCSNAIYVPNWFYLNADSLGSGPLTTAGLTSFANDPNTTTVNDSVFDRAVFKKSVTFDDWKAY